MTIQISPIEIQIGVARRAKNSPKPVVLPISAAECLFLLYRVADVTATAEAIVHHPDESKHISPWSRQQVVVRVVELVRHLREKPARLYLISRLDKAIIINAIEANPYFARMADGDPRLTVDAIRMAEHFRSRLQTALGQQVRRVPLGKGRSRIP